MKIIFNENTKRFSIFDNIEKLNDSVLNKIKGYLNSSIGDEKSHWDFIKKLDKDVFNSLKDNHESIIIVYPKFIKSEKSNDITKSIFIELLKQIYEYSTENYNKLINSNNALVHKSGVHQYQDIKLTKILGDIYGLHVDICTKNNKLFIIVIDRMEFIKRIHHMYGSLDKFINQMIDNNQRLLVQQDNERFMNNVNMVNEIHNNMMFH